MYEREWKDIFNVQSEVAQTIAQELYAEITPEEKQLIQKTPTTSLTAYDYYQRGQEQYWNYRLEGDRTFLVAAEAFYNEALKYDSTFAEAYVGLAKVYWANHIYVDYFTEDFLDSVLILVDDAIFYNNKIAEAYRIRGNYFTQLGKHNLAIKEFDRAILLNPNDWQAYASRGSFYGYFNPDIVKSIENYNRAVSLNKGPQLSDLLLTLSVIYRLYGFNEKSDPLFQRGFQLNPDSIYYYRTLGYNECNDGDYADGLEYLEKAYKMDTQDQNTIWALGYYYTFVGKYDESLKFIKLWLEGIGNEIGRSRANMHRLGYVYWQTGDEENANYYFDKQLDYGLNLIELGRAGSYVYYDLAAVYAFRGEKEKAYDNLRIFNEKKVMPKWMVTLIQDDPLFDNLRGEPEFDQIVTDVVAKNIVEHDRVKDWLEGQGLRTSPDE
jgi:tetratricopeptide (TPR) repeat protein